MTDIELLYKYRQTGQNRYLGALLERYSLLLLGYCIKYLKDEEAGKDAVQQVFAKVIVEVRKDYEIQFFKSWLFMIAKNYCLMQLRQKGIEIKIDNFDSITAQLDPYDTNSDYAKQEQLASLVEIGLENLNTDQKNCIKQFYLQKKSYQQIADIEGISLLQVKSAIQNGKRNIRIWIEKKIGKNNAS